MQTYEILVELQTGYTLQALEAAASADEARDNLFRKLGQMGWKPGREFTLGAPTPVEVTSLEHVIRLGETDHPEHDTLITESDYTDGGDYSNGGAA